jgi:hypothetical protein
VRKQIYRSVFTGGCGVSYGHHAVWQFYDPERYTPVAHPDRTWKKALERPAAWQMQHLRRLMESRSFHRIPDQSLLLSHPGHGREHIRATRAEDGSYAMIYILGAGRTVQVDSRNLRGNQYRAWWFEPRTGGVQLVGRVEGEQLSFTTPSTSPDWVLVLDSMDANLATPGVVTT